MSSGRVERTGIAIQINARSGKQFAPFVKRHLARAYGVAQTKRRMQLRDLSLAFVGDAAMSRLHRQFMGIDGPTDVLTFELDHNPRGAVIAGEVVICVPQAQRQARTHGTDIKDELLLYAIHGMLHLVGYDDLTDAGYRAMHREEDRILTAMKIGPVFDPVRGKSQDRATRFDRATRLGPAAHLGRKKDGRSR